MLYKGWTDDILPENLIQRVIHDRTANYKKKYKVADAFIHRDSPKRIIQAEAINLRVNSFLSGSRTVHKCFSEHLATQCRPRKVFCGAANTSTICWTSPCVTAGPGVLLYRYQSQHSCSTHTHTHNLNSASLKSIMLPTQENSG